MAALRGFAAFVARPSLGEPYRTGATARIVLASWLLVFSFAATALIALLALPLILLSGAAPGEGLRALGERSAFSVFVVVVILGPLIEEMLFRGWLTGTLRALGGATTFLAIVFGGAWLLRNFGFPTGLAAQAGFAAIGYLAFLAIERSGRGDHQWFNPVFPSTFWLQGVLFGALHFANIASDSVLLPLLMTFPLMICGWLWGYARVVLGFEAAWALHMAYNIPAGLVMAMAARAVF